MRHKLTPVECKIAGLLAAGLTLKQVAAELRIGYETTRTHVELARLKCGAATTAHLAVLWALESRDRSAA